MKAKENMMALMDGKILCNAHASYRMIDGIIYERLYGYPIAGDLGVAVADYRFLDQLDVEVELVDPYDALKDLVSRASARYQIPGRGPHEIAVGYDGFVVVGRDTLRLVPSDFAHKWVRLK